MAWIGLTDKWKDVCVCVCDNPRSGDTETDKRTDVHVGDNPWSGDTEKSSFSLGRYRPI